jgi:hypothetical protein
VFGHTANGVSSAEAVPISVRGQFSIGLDEEAEIIVVTARGFWSMGPLERHFDEFAEVVADQRASGWTIRVLVDLREADVQLGEVIKRVIVRTAQVYEPHDRLAIVIASSLSKMQLRHIAARIDRKFFISIDAARAWLGTAPADPAGFRGRC